MLTSQDQIFMPARISEKSTDTRIVLGFDSWSQGRAHYARIASPLKQLGFQLMLVHLGSWGHDKNNPLEEIEGDLIIRDIGYYEN